MPDLRIPPNLVLIILDGARAASFSGAEAGRVARTPAFDRIRAEGTTFTHAVAPGNWTLPSHLSFLTGTMPWTHHLRTFRTGRSRAPTIASWLSGRGYATGVFTEEVHLVAGYGLEDGYQSRFCPVPAMSDEERTLTNRLFGHTRWLYSERIRRVMATFPMSAIALTAPNFRAEVAFKRRVTDESTVHAFETWITRRDRSKPFHALVNVVDPHEPYEPTSDSGRVGFLANRYAYIPRFYLLTVPELRARVPWNEIEARYRTCLERADRKVGQIRTVLEERGEFDNTIFVVTSDHGQSFGEGGNIYHGCGATDSVLRVPLAVRAPKTYELPRQVDRWMSLCDLSSWFKSAALGEPPFDGEGHLLVPFAAVPPPTSPVLAEGGPASDPNLSLLGIGTANRWNHRLIAAYTEQEKYVLDTFARDVRRWGPNTRPDKDPPARLSSEETRDVLRRIFGVAEAREFLDEGDRANSPPRRALDDRRMRSWGYD